MLRAILIGGLACGACDYLFAYLYYQKATWAGIAKSVARGWLDGDTVASGAPWVVALGVALHFLISLGWAAGYVVASRWITPLARYPGPAGLVYGAVVYFGMNWVVVPLSAIGRFPAGVDWYALAGHLAVVGLPIALALRWFGPPVSRR